MNKAFVVVGTAYHTPTPDALEILRNVVIAVGSDGLFIETHPDPSNAKSDGANMLHLDLLEGLLVKLIRIRNAIS